MTFGFGNKIKQLRSELKLTQQGLADELMISRSTVSKWENESLEPNINSIKKMAYFFKVTIDTLLDYDPELYELENR